MRQRPYQVACDRAIKQALAESPSTLAVLATGLGKTVIFAHAARDWPGRVLVLAHRDELIRQAAQKIHAITGEAPAIEMADERSPEDAFCRPRVVVSSVQTMCRPKRQQRFRPADFGLLVIDEAHHAVARSYRDVIAYFRQAPGLRLLGVTATPKRTDRLAMGQLFDSVCYEYGIEAAIEDGWLVPVRQQAVKVAGLDFSAVKSIAGDFHEGELDRILSEEKVLHACAAPAAELVGCAPTLVFCVSVAHAKLMAAVLKRYRHGAQAVALDGTTPRDERARVVDAYKRGEIQFLCNCGLFLEGFDAPTTAAIVMARPTKSLALYTQILGRGTRPLPGVVDPHDEPTARKDAIAASRKPSMLVLDFVGNSGAHRIVNATDLLGGKHGEPVRAYARKTAEEEGEAAPVGESLERAADELALLKEIEDERRRRRIRAEVSYEAREVSPFAGGGGGARFSQGGGFPREPATDRQVNYLVYRAGWQRDAAARLSKPQASAIIGKHREGAAGKEGGR
jgi:superfamily II DNA or RNA helicase